MRYTLLLVIVFFIPLPAAWAGQITNEPFAVVELFTSQGCSSCPPAEELLTKLVTWARKNHQPVYALGFHVDYWNSYGWRDIFSQPEFTQRQQEYARIFKAEGVYTPEMIVNGTDAFVGSDQAHLQQDLDRELSLPAQASLQVRGLRKAGNIIVRYDVTGFSPGDVVHAALVERGLTTDIAAGENAGRTLYQDNVVREFQSDALKKSAGQISLPLDKIEDLDHALVLVYVQDPLTMMIKAAQQLVLRRSHETY